MSSNYDAFQADAFQEDSFQMDIPRGVPSGGGAGILRKEGLRLNRIRKHDDEEILLTIQAFLKIRG